jgi:hypothetical protein
MSPCERSDDGRRKWVEVVTLDGGEEDAVVAGRWRRFLQIGGGWKGGEAPMDLVEKACGAQLTQDRGNR